jgi:hypothetical protein
MALKPSSFAGVQGDSRSYKSLVALSGSHKDWCVPFSRACACMCLQVPRHGCLLFTDLASAQTQSRDKHSVHNLVLLLQHRP